MPEKRPKNQEEEMNGKKPIIIMAVIVIVALFGFFVLASVLYGIQVYNGIIKRDQAVKSAWAQVENQLQRRYDLIPNYVEVVKGYAKHEREVFIQVTEARAKVGGASTIDEKIKANTELSSALARLLAVVEAYPNLKANENFIRLQDELAGTENRIAVERKRYNEAVKSYNQYIKVFPHNIIARMFDFKESPFFEAPGEAKAPPKIEF
jgi:LemA protein